MEIFHLLKKLSRCASRNYTVVNRSLAVLFRYCHIFSQRRQMVLIPEQMRSALAAADDCVCSASAAPATLFEVTKHQRRVVKRAANGGTDDC